MATLPTSPTELTPEQLYLGHLKLIESVASHGARRCRFTKEETEDFVATVRLRLLEDGYAVIRKFQGKSTFSTYLNIVVNHLMQDYRNHVLGKWRVSTEAKRLGPVACRLDVLLNREGLPLDQAVEILRKNEKVDLSTQQLAEIAGKLSPHNPPRRMYGEEELEGRTAEAETPEERILGVEAARRKKSLLGLLRQALKDLPDQDRLIVLMRVRFPIVEIAKALHLDAKPLYPRIKQILAKVRAQLEGQGVSADDIREIFAFPEHDFDG